jgi:hypothetical protein
MGDPREYRERDHGDERPRVYDHRDQERQWLATRSSFADRDSAVALRAMAATSACIHERRLVSQTFASWNQIHVLVRRIEALQQAA